MTRRARHSRGFSLLEALIAAVIFLIALTAVSIMVTQAARLSRRGAMNAEMAQVARDQLQQYSITKAAPGPAGFTELNMGVKVNGVTLMRDTEVFDTSGPLGGEAANQFPGCPNQGAASKCVRVIIRDTATGAQYVTSTYVF